MRQHSSRNPFLHLFSPFRPSSLARLLGLGLLCAGSHSAQAANQTWSGTTDGNWVTGANWAAGVAPGSTIVLTNSDTATFNGAGNGNTTITIDPNRNLRTLIFDTAAASYTIGSAGANGGNSLLLTSSGSISMAATIAGTGLTQTINAPLILEPIAAGTSGAYTFTNASADATNRLVIAGNVSAGTITGTQTLTLGGTNTGNNVVSGAISDGGASGGLAVAKGGLGVWTLSGANTYTGATSIASSGGTLVGIGAHAFGSTSGISLNGNAASVLSLRGDSSTSFTRASDNSLYSITYLSSAPTINVDQATVAGTGAKTMSIGTIGFAATALSANFTGANNTSLNVGAITGGASVASSTTTLTNSIAGGGTLTIASYTSGNTGGGETINFAGTGTTLVTGAITPGATTLSLTKSNAGLLVLTGTGSTYTGVTSAGAGTLAGIGANAFGSTSGISVAGIGTLSLRGDASTAFVKASDSSAYSVTTTANNATIDVRSASGVTTSKTMTIGALALNAAISNNTNFTGADNTSLSVGAVSTGASAAGTETITNNIGGSGSLTLASFTSNRTGAPTVTFTGSGNTRVTGSITETGALALTKSGAGTLTLSGTNSYTGATTVSVGTLLVNGTHNGGSTNGYSVGATGILGGAGAITTGALTTVAGSKLTPGGNGVAEDLGITLASGASAMNISLSSNDTGAYLFDLAAPSASDKIVLTLGTLNIGTMTNADFVFTEMAGFGNGTYILFDASSAITGTVTSATDSIIFSGGRTGTLSIDSINNDVLLTVVPEPSAVALLGLGFAVTLWRFRTRRTV